LGKPALCIVFLLYLMRYVLTSNTSVSSESAGKILLVNSPHSFEVFLANKYAVIPEVVDSTYIREESGAYYDFLTYQNILSKDQAELVIVFPEHFDQMTAALLEETRPQILTYYDPSEPNSKAAHDGFIKNVLSGYGDAIQAQYDRISTSAPAFDVLQRDFSGAQSDAGVLGFRNIITRMIIPLVLFIAVMYACMEAGTVSIAGEKERGTFAAILLTPARRSEIFRKCTWNSAARNDSRDDNKSSAYCCFWIFLSRYNLVSSHFMFVTFPSADSACSYHLHFESKHTGCAGKFPSHFFHSSDCLHNRYAEAGYSPSVFVSDSILWTLLRNHISSERHIFHQSSSYAVRDLCSSDRSASSCGEQAASH